MSRFRNASTGVVVSVDDSKDERFGEGWESAEKEPAKRAAAKTAAKSESK